MGLHLTNGARDEIVPVAFGRDFEARSRASGDEVVLTVVEDVGHFELIPLKSRAFPAVRDAVLKFLGL